MNIINIKTIYNINPIYIWLLFVIYFLCFNNLNSIYLKYFHDNWGLDINNIN